MLHCRALTVTAVIPIVWLDFSIAHLPAPPKHYGVFDVLPIRKVFAKAKKPGVALEKGRDDRFPTRSKQTLGKDFPSATHTILLIGQYNRGSDIVSFPIPENDIESLRDFTHGLIALIFTSIVSTKTKYG